MLLAILFSDINAVIKKYAKAIIVKFLIKSLLGCSDHSHPIFSNL